MIAKRIVELNDASTSFRALHKRSTDSKHVSIGIPLCAFDEHVCVNQNGIIIREIFHELNSTTLVSNAERSRSLILVFVRETLLVRIIPFDSC